VRRFLESAVRLHRHQHGGDLERVLSASGPAASSVLEWTPGAALIVAGRQVSSAMGVEDPLQAISAHSGDVLIDTQGGKPRAAGCDSSRRFPRSEVAHVVDLVEDESCDVVDVLR